MPTRDLSFSRAELPAFDLRLPVRAVATFLVLMAGAGLTQGSSGEQGQAGNGCNNEQAAHVGCAGALGGGGILAKVCVKQGDNLVGAGAKLTDNALGLGADAGRHAGGAVARGAEHVGGRAAAEALTSSHWDEAAEVVGRVAGEEKLLEGLPDLAARHPGVADLGPEALLKYADENPGFWQEVGVELYLRDPAAWARLGGDELLDWAAAGSPAMREAVAQAAVSRFDDALRALSDVDLADDAARAAFEAEHGVRVADEAGAIFMEVASPDYSYTLRDVRPDNIVRLLEQLAGDDPPVDETPTSDRARFDAVAAERRANELLDGLVLREPGLDLPGLFAFRLKVPEADDIPVHWIGPQTHLEAGIPEDWERILGLLRAGEQPVDPQVFAELWVGFHQKIFSRVCLPTDGFGNADSAPTSEVVEGGVRYRFWARGRRLDCELHELFVPGPEPAAAPAGP